MAANRVPGSIGMQEHPVDFFDIDDGTSALTASPAPGYVYGTAPVYDLLSDLDRVRHLLDSSPQRKREFTPDQYHTVAELLGTEPEAMAAVAAVLATKSPAGTFPWPSALSEQSELDYQADEPDFALYHVATDYRRLAEAFLVDPRVALSAACWGMFRIQGAYFRRAGHHSVESFVLAVADSAQADLNAFVAYVRSDPALHQALQQKDWASFARGYGIQLAPKDQGLLEMEYQKRGPTGTPQGSFF